VEQSKAAADELLREEAREKEAAARPSSKAKKKAKAKAKAEEAAKAKAEEAAELERLEAEAAIALAVTAKEKVEAEAIAMALEEAARKGAALEAAEEAAKEEAAKEADADEPPDDLICPITQELMNDPVIAADGHTYERVAIERWLKTNTTSPKSGDELEMTAIFPNHLVRRMIREWQETYRS